MNENTESYLIGVVAGIAVSVITFAWLPVFAPQQPQPLEDFRCIEYAGTMQPENCVIWLRRGEPWPPEHMRFKGADDAAD